MLRLTNTAGALLLLVALVSGQQAYPPAPQYSQATPPAWGQQAGPPFQDQQGDTGETVDLQHGVARVSLIGGDVNLQRNGSVEQVAAVVNAPLLSQDRLQTAPGSSAEVQLDGETIVRLAQNTDVGFADLEAGRARLQFGAGTIIFRVLRETRMQTDIETPSIAIHPLGPVDLRIDVLENGSTQVTVRAGAADIYGPGGTQRLEAPRSVLVRTNAGSAEFQEVPPPPHDGLDDWSAGRDNELLSSGSYRYTGGEMAGAADLDANGSWIGSQYGQVWAPRTQDTGWAPYSDGQWVNEPYYGWTWVDAEPWGWAPFHYGRWFLNGGRGWCWWPGALGYRHSWGPAFVGFFGFGGGGGLGWVALAPFEGFHTWWGRGGYRGGRGVYPGVNRGFGGYQNAGFRGAAVGASFATFGGSRGRFNSLSLETVARATPIRGQLPVNGSAFRFQFVNRPAIPNSRLASAGARSFFQAPRPSQGIESGWSGARSGTGYGSQNGRSVQSSRAQTAGDGQSAGWQRFGDPRTPANVHPGFTGGQSFRSNQSESGWHQFGQPQTVRPSVPQNYRGLASPSYAPQGSQSYGNAQPSYRQPMPSYRAAPTSRAQAPTYRTQAPSYRAPAAPSAPRNQPKTSHSGGHNGAGSGGGHRR